MIVWQGYGFLALLIPILTYILTVKIFQKILGLPFMLLHSWPGALGILIGAGCVSLLATALNKPGRTLVDPRTGQTVVLRKRHSLFWIPMEYLPLAIAAAAFIMLFVKDGSTV